MEPRRIVLCDDDETLASLLEYVLVKEGFEVFVALDGRRALELLDEQKPHLLILDLDIPEKSGFDVLIEMISRAEHRAIGVIIMSGREKEEDVQRALRLGGLAFFSKPFVIDDLLAKIRALLPQEAAGA